MSIATDERVLTIERVFRATQAELFDAWTNPELLVEWWGPEGMTVPEHEMDVRQGGAWTTTMVGEGGERHTVCGVYVAIERPRRLVFTWAWRQSDGSRGHETEVEVRFTPVEGGTLQSLRQKSFENMAQRDNHGRGWSSSFNDLERFLARKGARP